MRTAPKITWSLYLMAGLLVSCASPAEKKPEASFTVAEEGGRLNEGQMPPQAPAPKPELFVKAISGLRLRKEPNPSSELLLTIPFGAVLQSLDSISTGQFVVEGKSGKMIKVKYENREGYVFDGFTIPGATPNLRPLQNGKYCFKSDGVPGYEYLAFTVQEGRILQGSGDGHNAAEDVSWMLSFSGFFEPDGKLLLRTVVENEGGVQAPCLETWEMASPEVLTVKRGQSKPIRFKKVDCIRD